MSNDVFVLVEHHAGTVIDATHELLGGAGELAGPAGGRVVACLFGNDDRALAERLGADVVLYAEHDSLAEFVPEAYVTTLAAMVEERQPRLVLIANTTVGMDVAGALSARTGRPLVAYCTGLTSEGDTLVATAQVYGGKLNAEVEVPAPAIASVVAGSFAPAASGMPTLEEFSAPEALGDVRTEFLRRVEPEVSDVDITGEDILVSVGRGIGGEENIELAQELAEALGGTVSASRPVTDAGWLPKTRQVGKSGRKVKPKFYLACGISGAPEHLEGMGDAELIIAINSDEKAPIFDVAHYGTTQDLFEVLPALTEALQGVRT
ncbi:MAG TPA: electron transfer flavoprotein subunit alpha/FixB family protein [Solirubrobacteraceae bacterium]|nr:electron transfer flavoprotein subunit alpha/FixB family protein [Solirubrobacteraceae bacterium]